MSAVGAVDTAADAVVVGAADGGGPADAEHSAGFEGNISCFGFLGVDGREPAFIVPGSRPEPEYRYHQYRLEAYIARLVVLNQRERVPDS